MAATTQRHAVASRLREFRRQPGNWRLKGLLLAHFADAATVGECWPMPPPERQPLVALASRHPDTDERALARSQFGTDALEANEFVPRDQYYARLLVSGTPEELDVLWREEIVSTVQLGADIRRMARDAATVTPVDARKGDIPIDAETPFAETGAAGGGAQFDEQDYHNEAYNCELHEEGFAVTDEQVDHNEVGQIEYEIRRAGEAVENAINRQLINELLDNATNYDADLSGSGNTDVRDLLLKASEVAADNDFDPTDTVVMHPEYESELFGNNQAFGVAAPETADYEALGREFFVQSGTAYDAGTQTYGFESDGDHGALVYGRPFVHIPVYRDVGVTEIGEDSRLNFEKDLQGGVARAQTDVVAVDVDGNGTYESVIRVQR